MNRVHHRWKSQDNCNDIFILPVCRLSVHIEFNCNALQRSTLYRIHTKSQAVLKVLLRRISCHGRNYSQPCFFKRNQSNDNCSHGFGAKFLLKKLSASDFSYERKSAFSCSSTVSLPINQQ